MIPKQNQDQQQEQNQKQNLSRSHHPTSIFPGPIVRSAGTLSRLSAALRPLSRHSVALTKLPYALLFLLRYGENERKKMGGSHATATTTAKPCILSAGAPAIVGETRHQKASEGKKCAASIRTKPADSCPIALKWEAAPPTHLHMQRTETIQKRIRELTARAEFLAEQISRLEGKQLSDAERELRALEISIRHYEGKLASGSTRRIPSAAAGTRDAGGGNKNRENI
jgi:hypothetical protein